MSNPPFIRPMAGFDPSKPAMVYDALNERRFRWEPAKWLASYMRYATPHGDDVVEWDGLLLSGWWPIGNKGSLARCTISHAVSHF